MSAPAVLVAIPLLIGVLIGALQDVAPACAIAGLLVMWALAGFALRRGEGRGFVAGSSCAFLCAGMALGAAAQHEAIHSSLLDWYVDAAQAPARLTGVLSADAATTATSVSLQVDVQRIGDRPVHGGVRLSVSGELAAAAAPAWRAGRTVIADAALREPLDYRDPGVPSDRLRLARQGTVLLGTVKSAALVSVIAAGGTVSEAAAAVRAFVRRAAARSIAPWDVRSAGVATAILIGDRGGLDPEDERRLQAAGTYHVIAISGGNIALLTALLVMLGRLARLPARGTAVMAIALLAFYGYAAGLAPSVLRATLAGIVYLVGRATDHRGAALNAVAVAAATAAVASPLTLLDPGFVLSFGATLAIVIAAARVTTPPLLRPDRHATRTRRIVNGAGFAAWMLLVATVCAEIALAPIGARLFGRVSLAGLVLNFLAIPLMSIIQVAGIAAVALTAISSTLGLACGWVVQLGTRLLLWSASLVDVAPWLVLDVPPPALWVMAAWYAGWAGVLGARKRSLRGMSTAVAVVTGVVMIAGMPATRAVRVPAPPAGWSRVVFLDVGQGDATLIEPAGGPPMLIDAGGVPGSSFDLGRRVTLPAAWAFGVRRLGTLVLTHGDPDHIGGASPILRALRPREVWDGVSVPRHEPMQRLRDTAAAEGIRWIERRTGESVTVGAAIIRVLNPPAPDWERQKVRNDDSIVLEVRIGDVVFVLPGDITRAVEPAVAAAFQRAATVVVKAPHHGSAGSSSPAFVEALRPSIVVFSAGRRNPFGHPAPVVVDRYRAAGARVFSTAEAGAIVIDTDGTRVSVWTDGRR